MLFLTFFLISLGFLCLVGLYNELIQVRLENKQLAHAKFFDHINMVVDGNNTISTVRVLTVKNKAIWPAYHTALEFSGPGFNQTYGFYSTLKGPKNFLLFGWFPHQGRLITPDLFLEGSSRKKISPGTVVDPVLKFNLTAEQTYLLQFVLKNYTSDMYSLVNWKDVSNNCASWAEYVINEIVFKDSNTRLDCSCWIPVSVPSACRILHIN